MTLFAKAVHSSNELADAVALLEASPPHVSAVLRILLAMRMAAVTTRIQQLLPVEFDHATLLQYIVNAHRLLQQEATLTEFYNDLAQLINAQD